MDKAGDMDPSSPLASADAAPQSLVPHTGSISPPHAPTPKNVAFELMFSNAPQYRARLPMRVQIYPHDTTDSIVTTVKNFYGLYSGPTGSKGVSFEDDQGNTLIARYENFRNNIVVYVRVIEESSSAYEPSPFHPTAAAARPYYPPDGYPPHLSHHLDQGHGSLETPASYRRSLSPPAERGRMSDSLSNSSKTGRSRSVKKQRPLAYPQRDAYSDSMGGYSSGDGAPSTTSGKNKDQLGNTDISLENIVEGGRRKRAKFESSELPLFAPPQMPAATSNPSVSPARRLDHHRPSLPMVQPGQNPFTNPRPLQSPQHYGNVLTHSNLYATPAPQGHRSRGSFGFSGHPHGLVTDVGVLPTPDPTVGSCMSEEDKDVAIQLMRLGESSNTSHGRTSASTLDDTFSGRADVASSARATSDAESFSEDDVPAAHRPKPDTSRYPDPVYQTTESRFVPAPEGVAARMDPAYREPGAHSFIANDVKLAPARKPMPTKPELASVTARQGAAKPSKSSRPAANAKPKKALGVLAPALPLSPTSVANMRKQSIPLSAQFPQLVSDEQPDLSKPRCQRCRKSKKGCDRQRPCGRCRDAGLSAEQCISEDEGNGRKGRFGRHMGVPLQQDENAIALQPVLPARPFAPVGAVATEKAKKRKR